MCTTPERGVHKTLNFICDTCALDIELHLRPMCTRLWDPCALDFLTKRYLKTPCAQWSSIPVSHITQVTCTVAESLDSMNFIIWIFFYFFGFHSLLAFYLHKSWMYSNISNIHFNSFIFNNAYICSDIATHMITFPNSLDPDHVWRRCRAWSGSNLTLSCMNLFRNNPF